ncbi:response regulator [Mucilaginibacter sp. RS28]|uniref:Response regulator n=1 Tax=Mucilaginibacter straminoryzae TaxID=2932774 RepID=A0A9X2B9H9_9SPHI|nr:response regulator [Mucilaginibacter straminoryzae]MCJ8210466.1 response regulator [Mucilaginibacter straminoryzae]
MKKVLVLDNDEAILEAMQDALNYEGYDVRTVTDCDCIFTLINEYQPDILLIDYILNGINGGELCHQVKNEEKTAALPVILMSAYPRIIDSLGNYGCDAFVAKPFDLYELTARMAQLISTTQHHLYA